MASDHRGNEIHAGKRTDDEMHATRLAKVIKTHANNANQDAGDPPVSLKQSQDHLDAYRNSRHRDYDPEVQKMQAVIKASFKNRHDKQYGFEDVVHYLPPSPEKSVWLS